MTSGVFSEEDVIPNEKLVDLFALYRNSKLGETIQSLNESSTE